MQQHIQAIADSFKVGESESNCLLTMLASESTSKDGWLETSQFSYRDLIIPFSGRWRVGVL